MSLLKVQESKIVNEQGEEVVLRGAGLGGWMNMENFISGFPGCEFQIREALAEAVGEEKRDLFFDKFLEHFFDDADARFFKSLGLNCIRIAFNYRHFEDDMNPRVLKVSGFKHLDRVINVCAQHGIYTILDLHAAPGGQNTDWHSDHGGHQANFWTHKDFQDRALWLWTELARHYAGNKWIAGYNPLNEPTDAKHTRLIDFYNKVHSVIRTEDPDHIIFLDGNTFASDFTQFGDAHKNWDNTAYSIHDYSVFGFPSSPQVYEGTEEQKRRLRRSYEKKRAWMDERGLCVWNGEFGPVYARPQYDGDLTDSINASRYKLLEDQLAIYDQDRLSWSIWLYKDIGFQGMVHTAPTTKYMTHFHAFLAKKHWLAVDAWGADDTRVAPVYAPLLAHIEAEIPEENRRLYPTLWTPANRVTRLARNILVSEYLVREWAQRFVGLEEFEIEELARSFRFENCLQREELNGILRARSAPH